MQSVQIYVQVVVTISQLEQKEIYANKMSLTGSIGVIGNSFGFTELMKKLGVERRTYAAGKTKLPRSLCS